MKGAAERRGSPTHTSYTYGKGLYADYGEWVGGQGARERKASVARMHPDHPLPPTSIFPLRKESHKRSVYTSPGHPLPAVEGKKVPFLAPLRAQKEVDGRARTARVALARSPYVVQHQRGPKTSEKSFFFALPLVLGALREGRGRSDMPLANFGAKPFAPFSPSPRACFLLHLLHTHTDPHGQFCRQ